MENESCGGVEAALEVAKNAYIWYNSHMNENINKSSALSDALESALHNEVPEMKFEIVTQGDKTIFVCDYSPKELPWNPHEEITDPDTRLFQRFYNAYRNMAHEGHYGAMNISSKGWTDLHDVRCLIGQGMGNNIWIMPRLEWQKLSGKPFIMKNEKIIELCRKRLNRNRSSTETYSADALLGNEHAQLPAVLSGLKPMAVEMSFHDDPFLMSVIEMAPNLRGVVLASGKSNSSHGHHADSHGHSRGSRSDQVLYNPIAVERVIKDNKLLFEKLGMQNKSVEEIVIFISKWHFDSIAVPPGLEGEMSQALGLLLGFDRISCEPDKYHVRGRNQFIAPDHAQAHPFNEIPFNFFGVDYKIYDPENNIAFHELRRQYDQVVTQIEQNLEQGMSPRDTLIALNGRSDSSHSMSKITYDFKPNKSGKLDGVRNFPRYFYFNIEPGSASEEEAKRIIAKYEEIITRKVMDSHALWEDANNQAAHADGNAFTSEEFELDDFIGNVGLFVERGLVRIRIDLVDKNWKKKREEEIERLFSDGGNENRKKLHDLTEVTGGSLEDELKIVDRDFDPTQIVDGGDRPVDAPIMELVRILNMAGIETTNSCGGHIEREGHEKNRGHGISKAGEIHLPYLNIAWESFPKFAKALIRFGKKAELMEFTALGLNNVYCSFPEGTPLKIAQQIFEELTDFLADEIHGEHEKELTLSETLYGMKRKVKSAINEAKE